MVRGVNLEFSSNLIYANRVMAPPPRTTPVIFALITATTAAAFTRAMWVTSEALYSEEEIERLVATAAAYGFDALFVQVRRAGDAYYLSASEPRSRKLEGQPADYDPLATTIKLARLFNIEVHAWLNVNYVWPGPEPPPMPTHVARKKPGWVCVGRDGRRMTSYSRRELRQADAEGWYVDPAEPAFAEYFARVAAEVASNYEVAGIHLDFIRYPNVRFGYGERPRAKFNEERQEPDPSDLGYHAMKYDRYRPAVGAAGITNRWFDLRMLEWLDWRAANVTRIVTTTRDAVKRTKPEAVFSAAVWANPEHAYRYVGQYWLSWYREGLVDVIIPMTYWGDAATLGAVACRLDEIRPRQGKHFIGIGAFNHDPTYSGATVAALRDYPVDGVVLFDYASCWRKPQTLPMLAEKCSPEKTSLP